MPLFFIAVVAPEVVNKQVLVWKEYMREKFGCKVALRSPAHVTLVPPFSLAGEKEAAIGEVLERFASEQQAFEVGLKDFGAFAPRVIFVYVQVSEALSEIKSSLEDVLIAKNYPVKKETRPFHPHVTLANRDLVKKDFPKAWAHFSELKYSAEFVAEDIALLINTPGGWEVSRRFRFGL